METAKDMKSDWIYRVTIRKTGSLQPDYTYWSQEVVYCGPSLTEARIAYLREVASDVDRGYGNACRYTELEKFDGEPDEIDDTTAYDVEA